MLDSNVVSLRSDIAPAGGKKREVDVMRKGIRFFLLLGILICALGEANLPAQTVEGTLLGRVTDASGGSIPGVAVTARQQQTGYTRTFQTSSEGEYIMPLMPVGTYEITAHKEGFAKYTRQGVQVTVGQQARVDLQLVVGKVVSNVVVIEQANMVNTQTSEVSGLVDARRIVELPLSGRNVLALAGLQPGVTDVSAPQSFDTARFGPTMHINGTRYNDWGEFLDGTLDMTLFRNTGLNLPPPDAIQEFRMVLNSYSAEFGRVPSGSVNAVSKSGTNQVHGTVYEFLRNDDLDARNFFSPTVPVKKQNQFGASVGYFLPLPHHKRLYLFGNYEGLRIHQSSVSDQAVVPTTDQRSGIFSYSIIDPSTGLPFSNNTIPPQDLNPVATAVLKKVPLPNAPEGTLVTLYSAPESLNQFFIRADYDITPVHRFTFHIHNWRDGDTFGLSRSTNVPGWSPGFQRTETWNLAPALTSTLSPTLLNELRLGYNQTYSPGGNFNHFDLNSFGANFPATGTPPFMDVGGEFTMEPQIDGINKDKTYQVADTVTWIRGRSTLKTGGQYWRLRSTFNCNYLVASFTEFNGQFTGDPIADFLLGRPSLFQSEEPWTIDDVKSSMFSLFAQEEYKVSPKLTLNLGLRYELQMPWASPQHLFAAIREGQQSTAFPAAPVGMVYAGDKGIPPGLIPTRKDHFAPRVGFAWDLFGDGRTAVRGAFGIFFGSLIAASGQFANSQPFQVFRSFDVPPGGLSDPLRGEPPAFPSGTTFILPIALSYLDPSITEPYYEQVNLTVQHQFRGDWSGQIGYVGNMGRHLVQQIDWNPALPGPTATLDNIEQRRVYEPGVFTDGLKTITDGLSSFNSLQAQVEHRWSKGYSVLVSYTYSRNIDTMSGAVEDATTSNPFNSHFDRARSDFDRTHVLAVSYVYELPRLTSSPTFVRKVAGGWEFTGIASYKTGVPVDVETDRDDLAIGTYRSYLQRPDLVGDFHRSHVDKNDYLRHYFNKAAFVYPCQVDSAGVCIAGTAHWGNFGRNVITGPGFENWDMGLFKNTTITERLSTQFRAEFFNIFNRANFKNPNPYMDSSRFGRITSAYGGREVQFSLKLMF